jgi:predicted Zn-dependent protease
MQFIKTILLLFIISLITFSCIDKTKQVTNAQDYDKYLAVNENKSKNLVNKDLKFWSEKLKKNPTQYIYLSPIASNEGQLFCQTGNIDYLKKQEEKLKRLNIKTTYTNAGYLRSAARNFITQHRFKESLELLLKAEKNGEKLKATQKMLFDVYLELGNAKEAKKYLNKIKNFRNFDYLIRLSKWSDYKGDLKNAINYMESAIKIAEFSKNINLKKWVYTNIADYYGHSGEIKKSYNHYLKALEINPSEAYAKKGIAWIVYSYEKNPNEALRIMNSLDNQLPDYYLLKAEIAEFQNNKKEKKENIEKYLAMVNNPKYGDMYNKYTILLCGEDLNDFDKALNLSQREINNRPTTQSYDLLAWTYYNKGEIKKALKIINKHVVNKTSEPEALYHITTIFKANNMDINQSDIIELKESSYELGPILSQKIKLL